MKPISISLRIVRDDLRDVIKRINSPQFGRDLMHEVVYEFWNITRMNFGVSGVDRPIAWEQLSASYVKRLQRKSLGTPLVPTLLRAGTLINSIRFGNITPTSGEVWTDCPYAAVHQFGGRAGKGAYIPARPYFPVQSTTSYGTDAQLTHYAQGKIDAVISRAISKALNS